MPVFLLTGVLAVLLVLMTWAAAVGLLPANGLVGLRTPALLRSEEGWRAGHLAALRVLLPVGVVVLGACGYVAAVRPWSPDTTRVVGGALLVVLIGAALLATSLAHRRAKAVLPARPAGEG